MSGDFRHTRFSKGREGTENIHSWIERLNPTVNVLHAPSSISYFEMYPVDVPPKAGENDAG
jgi:hypothetical protein